MNSLSLNTGSWKRLKASLFSRDLTTISIGLQCVFLSHWRNVHWIVEATLLPWKIDMGMTIADKNVAVRKETIVLRSHFWQMTACLILHKTATRWTLKATFEHYFVLLLSAYVGTVTKTKLCQDRIFKNRGGRFWSHFRFFFTLYIFFHRAIL